MVFLVAMLVLPGTLSQAVAQECVSANCHSSMGKAKYVHGPIRVGQCVVCHTNGDPGHPTQSVKTDFKLQAEGKDLCYLCHERNDNLPVVHDPVAQGTCIGCHDPHQSNTEKQLIKETTSQLCFECHENNKTNMKVVHAPVAAGDCMVCHNPHSAQFPGLVKRQGSELCFLCHLDRRAQFELQYKHRPAAESCNKCHNSHATDFPFLLQADGQNLCFKCHREMERHLVESRVKHSALANGQCTVCHTAHASDYPKQLKASAGEICYTCHQEMKTQVEEATYVHGPVGQDDCYACHDAHGSNYTKILKKPFPAEFYTPYATQNYALCFDCHNQGISMARYTTVLTGFRNGDTNLHFLHVNRDKGRSCRACHEMHAGDQAGLIRKEVPFGKMWTIPVNFTRTENGGGCVVGCHRPMDYDRLDPVKY